MALHPETVVITGAKGCPFPNRLLKLGPGDLVGSAWEGCTWVMKPALLRKMGTQRCYNSSSVTLFKICKKDYNRPSR